MLTRLHPVEFVRQAPTGKTQPAFLLCEDAQGQEIEVIAKLSAKSERGLAGLAMEVVVACLAGDLGIPVPQPFLVELDPDWIEAIRPVNASWAAAAQNGSQLAFASKRLPDGFSAWIPGSTITEALRGTTAEVLLLDAVMKNADRRRDNPNCLKRGDAIFIIDHELCFPEFLLGLGDAWSIGGLQPLSTPGWHIFGDALHGKEIDWAPTIDAWSNLSDAMVNDYGGAVPLEWGDAMPVVQAAIDRIKLARDNVEACTTEVQRVLIC